MGGPNSAAKIEFPESALKDAEIRNYLKEYHAVEFAPMIFGESKPELIKEGYIDTEIEIKDGIFSLEESEVRDGCFALEDLLKTKGIPFERTTHADWGIPASFRVFRPATNGTPEIDSEIDDDDDSGVYGRLLRAVRDILPAVTADHSYWEPWKKEVDELEASFLAASKSHGVLEFPPLTDYLEAPNDAPEIQPG